MPTPKNWILNGATAGQWNTLVTDNGAMLSAVLIANTLATAATVQLRLATSGGSPLTTILPAHTMSGYGADVLNLKSLAIGADQQLQIYVGESGVNAVATGVL